MTFNYNKLDIDYHVIKIEISLLISSAALTKALFNKKGSLSNFNFTESFLLRPADFPQELRAN